MGARQIKLLLAYYLFTFILGGSMTLESDALAQSLLKGATPPNFTVPAGWQTYSTQTFESGVLNASLQEFTNNGGGICTVGETFVSAVKAHSGTKSMCNRTNTVGFYNSNGWGYESMPSREYYVSWWQYLDSNFATNNDWYIWQAMKNVGQFQEVFIDMQPQQYNDCGGGWHIFSQGAFEAGVSNLRIDCVPKGAWHQYEVWYKANTPGLSDGFVKLYIDGFLWISKGPTTINGSVDMSGARLMLSGAYNRIDWGRNADGSGSCSGFAVPPGVFVCYAYGSCPCNPQPPIFNNYLDDIIVLIRTGTADTAPPNPPTALSVN